MPPKSKRQRYSSAAKSIRDENAGKYQYLHKEEQMDLKDRYKDGPRESDIDLVSELDLHTIGDLFELLKMGCGSRNLSILVYMITRYMGHSWRSTDSFLTDIGAYRCQAAHKQANFLVSGDMQPFLNDGRGGKYTDSFHDVFPELEIEGRAFASGACSQRTAIFTVFDLAHFIDTRFYELTRTIKTNNQLVRSEKSCRLELRRWGAKLEANSQQPYFEGHERADVVTYRQEFVSYFLNRTGHYYTISEGDQPNWQFPTQKPCVLICKLQRSSPVNNNYVYHFCFRP